VAPPASLDASLPGRTDAGCDGGDATDDAAVAALAGMGFDTHGAGDAEPEEEEQESGRGGRKRRAPKHFGDDEDDGFAPRQRTLKPSATTQPRFRYVPVAGTDAITAAAVVAAAMPPVVRRSDGSVPRYTGSRARFTPEAKAVLAKAVAENRGVRIARPVRVWLQALLTSSAAQDWQEERHSLDADQAPRAGGRVPGAAASPADGQLKVPGEALVSV